jgi:signal transduction histidine kinase/ActR/RegA family two-component response regulator
VQAALLTTVPLLSASLTGACAISIGVRQQRAPGARAYGVVLLAQTCWSLGYVAELMAPDLRAKLFWDGLQLGPVFVITLGLLLFAFDYAGRRPPRLFALFWSLSVLPALACLWVFSDPIHGLARASARVLPAPPFGALTYEYTPIEWAAYAESCLIGGYVVVRLLAYARSLRGLPRRQALVFALATLCLLLSGLFGLLDLQFLGQRDVTPLGFGAAALLVTWGLRRYRSFDLVPIARDAVVEHLADAVFVFDGHLRLLDSNPAARYLVSGAMTGLGEPAEAVFVEWPNLLGGLLGQDELPRFVTDPKSGRSYEPRLAPALTPDGTSRGMTLVLRDVTDRQRAEQVLQRAHDELEQRVAERTLELSQANASLRQQIEETRAAQAQLNHAQKLDSIGRLAGGVAHDFNNLLTAILGNVQLARLEELERAEVDEHLADIEQAARSATALTRQLLAFARRQIVEPRVLDLNEIVSGVRKLLARLLGEDVELRLELAPELHPVRLDPSQVEQILVNLAVNARDAMPNGGWLAIRTQNERRPQVGGDAEEGESDYVALSVQDNGVGIAEEVLPLVFEPFFTTKPQGAGTGLGLSTVYGAVQQAGGLIEVTSAKGEGTNFTIHFPRTISAVTRAPHEEVAPRSLSGTETIALVEDQALVRSATKRQLESLGYNVLDFASAEQAQAQLNGRLAQIDLLVTDVVLSGDSGRVLAEALRQRRPELNVLFMSGYTEDVVIRHGVELGAVAFLQKPFSAEQLGHAVRRALDAAAPAVARAV